MRDHTPRTGDIPCSFFFCFFFIFIFFFFLFLLFFFFFLFLFFFFVLLPFRRFALAVLWRDFCGVIASSLDVASTASDATGGAGSPTPGAYGGGSCRP